MISFSILIGQCAGFAHTFEADHLLAVSGVLILLVLANMKGSADGDSYLLVFGLGLATGMAFAAGLFSVPFSKKYFNGKIYKPDSFY
jgi:uncharacterized membrane protein YhhN